MFTSLWKGERERTALFIFTSLWVYEWLISACSVVVLCQQISTSAVTASSLLWVNELLFWDQEYLYVGTSRCSSKRNHNIKQNGRSDSDALFHWHQIPLFAWLFMWWQYPTHTLLPLFNICTTEKKLKFFWFCQALLSLSLTVSSPTAAVEGCAKKKVNQISFFDKCLTYSWILVSMGLCQVNNEGKYIASRYSKLFVYTLLPKRWEDIREVWVIRNLWVTRFRDLNWNWNHCSSWLLKTIQDAHGYSHRLVEPLFEGSSNSSRFIYSRNMVALYKNYFRQLSEIGSSSHSPNCSLSGPWIIRNHEIQLPSGSLAINRPRPFITYNITKFFSCSIEVSISLVAFCCTTFTLTARRWFMESVLRFKLFYKSLRSQLLQWCLFHWFSQLDGWIR